MLARLLYSKRRHIYTSFHVLPSTSRLYPQKLWYAFVAIILLPLIFDPPHSVAIGFKSDFKPSDYVYHGSIDDTQQEKLCNLTKTNEDDLTGVANSIFEGVLQNVGFFWTEKVAGTAAEHISSHQTGQFVSKTITKRNLKKTSGSSLERTGQKLSLAWKSGERTAERAGSKISQITAEHVGQSSSKRLAERAGKRFSKFSSGSVAGKTRKIVPTSGKRIVENNAERIIEKIGGEIMIQPGKSLVQITGEKLVTKPGGGGITKRALEHTGERILDRTNIPKILLTNGRDLSNAMYPLSKTNKSSLSLVSHQKNGMYRSARRITRDQHRKGTQGLTKTPMGKRIALKMQSLSQGRVFGRILLMILPILGGIFALHLFRSDWVRINEEKKKGENHDETTDIKFYLVTMALFYCVAIADLLDAVCHFALSYFVLTSSVKVKPKVINIEKLSLSCAIMSTACAIIGELMTFISTIQSQNRRKEIRNV